MFLRAWWVVCLFVCWLVWVAWLVVAWLLDGCLAGGCCVLLASMCFLFGGGCLLFLLIGCLIACFADGVVD